MNIRHQFLAAIIASLCLSAHAAAQSSTFGKPQVRILRDIDESNTIPLKGNVNPMLAAASGSQAAADTTPMEHIMLFLKGDATQEARLEQLISQQNDPKSSFFHHYLTPVDFGAQFGVAQADLVTVTSWLQNHGFIIDQIPSGNRVVVFSGTAGQIAEAFKTEIRRYTIDGAVHYANATDPHLPAALADVIGGIVKLHDFRYGHSITTVKPVSASQLSTPQFTSGSSHYLAPADYSTIYDIGPLYSAGINGTGQTIAVIARSNILMSDVQTFRTDFGLKANNPQIVITNSDPGVLQGDSVETTLDTEWSGAIAPNATVKVIVSASNYADGIDLSAVYAVNHNVAPIISLSYGSCEAAMGSSELAFYNSLWKQAAAQGQSVLVSSGDSGAAGCDYGTVAVYGQNINGLCSSPYATCVGGTQFVDIANPGQYWLAGNNPIYGSAIGYIPETVWNESGSNGGSGLWGGGGGVSITYAKPAWQAGPGVPNDGKRDVPDVSLAAAGHDGYLIWLYGALNSVGGTSAAAPSFAGMMALVNQKLNSPQGLVNPILYPLAAKQASGGAAVFHDIKTGNNSVPGQAGFAATVGYDRASGLGTVDANLLVNHWNDASAPNASLSLTSSSSWLTVNLGQSSTATITSAGTGLSAAVVLAVAGVPPGVTATFSATSIAQPGSGSVSLKIAAGSSATPGTYSLAVNGTSGSQTSTIQISLIIPTPNFVLSANTSMLNVLTGAAAQVVLTVSPQNGFSSAVALSVSGLPGGVTGAFSPLTSGTSVLSLNVSKSTKAGSYPITISASGGGLVHSTSVSLVVAVPPVCNLVSNPQSVSLTAGDSSNVQMTCAVTQGTFSGPLVFTALGSPNGVTTQIAQTSATAATLRIGTVISSSPGKYNLLLTAAGSGYTQTVSVPLTITAPATFALTASASSLSAKVSSVAQLSATTLRYGSFNSGINFTVTGLPAGVTSTLSSPAIAAPGAGTVGIAFNVASSAKAGIYSIMISASGGGQTHSIPVTLTITASQDFALAVSVPSLTFAQGGAGTVIVSTGNFTGGFNSTITITFGGLAPGMNWKVLGGSPGNNMVNVSDSFTAAKNTPVGSYPITITASGAGITHSATVVMTITAASGQAKN